MLETAAGLILRTRPLTESSLIIRWLTPTYGRIDTVAKGALRPKSPFRGKLDLFYQGEMSFRRSRRSELHTLSEVILQHTNTALRTDWGRLQQACYCAELVEHTTETGTPLPGVYSLMCGLMGALARTPPQARTVFAFELRLLEQLGLQPDPERVHLSSPGADLLRQLSCLEWEDLPAMRPPAEVVSEVARFLRLFLYAHLERVPRNRDAAINAGVVG